LKQIQKKTATHTHNTQHTNPEERRRNRIIIIIKIEEEKNNWLLL
jgi:hypothetical protein